jgi:hypothetical protein
MCKSLYEIIQMNMIKLKIVLFSLCSFVILHQDIVHLYLRFDSRRGGVKWVSVWNNKDEYEHRVILSVSLCSFLILQQDILHLHLWFYSRKGRVKWVSVYNNKDEYEHRVILSRTALFFNLSPRHCAPLSPIWFEERLSKVSVCMQ